jgi:hypothetical protein
MDSSCALHYAIRPAMITFAIAKEGLNWPRHRESRQVLAKRLIVLMAARRGLVRRQDALAKIC